jgi:hypothetical protein
LCVEPEEESPPSCKLLVKTDAQKAAEAKAIELGANLLKSSQLSSASEQGFSAQAGGTVKYIGSDWVSVFYMDLDIGTVRYAHVDATMLASGGGDPVQWSPTYPFVQNP